MLPTQDPFQLILEARMFTSELDGRLRAPAVQWSEYGILKTRGLCSFPPQSEDNNAFSQPCWRTDSEDQCETGRCPPVSVFGFAVTVIKSLLGFSI